MQKTKGKTTDDALAALAHYAQLHRAAWRKQNVIPFPAHRIVRWYPKGSRP